MPTVLEQLRAAQRDAGITAPEHPEQEVIIRGTELSVLNPEYLAMGKSPAPPRPIHIGPAPTGIPVAHDPGVKPAIHEIPPGPVLTLSFPTMTLHGAGGYIKIVPPTFQSIRDIPPEWIEANWTKPSPWCRMEGQPDHPEFEANLAGVER